jgi:hypothetical protein
VALWSSEVLIGIERHSVLRLDDHLYHLRILKHAGIQKRMDIAINGLHISPQPARCLTNGPGVGSSHHLSSAQRLPVSTLKRSAGDSKLMKVRCISPSSHLKTHRLTVSGKKQPMVTDLAKRENPGRVAGVDHRRISGTKTRRHPITSRSTPPTTLLTFT